MELQALRYAAMLSTVDFLQVVEAYTKLLTQLGLESEKAEQTLLVFLDKPSANQVEISNTPRIILMAPSFSLEMTTTVLWLNERGLDIRCLSVVPYEIDTRRFLEIEQLIPLPSAADYLVKKKAKEVQAEKKAVAKKDAASWLTLIDNGVLQPGDQMELTKLPNNVLAFVPQGDRLAELLPAPKGQVRWLADGTQHSISGLCTAIYAKYAPQTSAPLATINGPAFWSRLGEQISLAELARTQSMTGEMSPQ